MERSIECKTVLNVADLQNVTYDLFGLGLAQDGLFISTKVLKYEMFPFKKVFANDSVAFYSYASPSSGFTLYQSSLIKDKGLRVQDLECFNDLIDLLDESRSAESLKFKIDYLNSQFFGRVNAKLYFTELF